MEAPAITIRGLINDLTRTLTGSLVHLDDLLLQLDNDSEEFDNAWLANQQMERALELFIELRSIYLIWQEKLQYKRESLGKGSLSTIDILTHKLNNALLVIIANCDLMSIYGDKSVDGLNNYQSIYKTIENIKWFICETLNPNRYRFPNSEVKKALINNTKINRPPEKGKRIMLVEDDEDVMITIAEALAKAGYKIFACATGREAITLFDKKKSRFSLYIVDYGLPDINGAELVKNFILRKPEINILFTTGYNELILQEHSGLICQHQILMKPFSLPELYGKVRSILLH
jgi:CheY-like chemotaxis protein